ncbi:hypothetical protein DFH08DRAFT_975752 [Mycena albidolilacea]|uniref:Uncharacterized protein n=1 Tax=Mycena albidolilacea TaxID=1033008 RepID=A0AAD6Z4T5_9AGAR|nr:hypothetical protein DFH08DRAFT_975752 [Mycena albidolilacea]
MSPPCSGSPQDSDAEPEELVDDDSDNNWEDVPGKATPPSRKQVAQKQIPRLGDSNDDGDLPDVAGVLTWLERNPGKHAIPPRDRPKCVIGPEQRRTLYDRAKGKKNRKAALYAEIAELNKKRNKKLPVLAKKHGFKLKLVKQRMAAATTFKQERKRIPDHPDFENMSKEFRQKLRADLLAHRAKRVKDARVTNKGVAQSAGYTMRHLASEIDNLYERSGMHGFAIFSKGHIQDLTEPYIMQSAGSLDFFREVLRLDPLDVIAKFEQWCCAREKGFTGVDTLGSMRAEVTKMIKTGLVFASRRQKCAMNYERYIKAVVLGYGCELVGWPKTVNFVEEHQRGGEEEMEGGGPNKRTKAKRATVKKGKGKSKAMSEEEDNGEDDEDGSEDNDDDEDEDEDEDGDEDEDMVETSKSKSKSSNEKEKECAKKVKERKAREEKERKAREERERKAREERERKAREERERKAREEKERKSREERKAKERSKEKRAKAMANKLSGGGRKRKTVDDDESNTEHTAKKSRGGEGGLRKKRGREEDDDEDEEPLAKKTKQPKPRPAYCNAPPASAPSPELPPGPPSRATVEFLKLSQRREKVLAATAALKAKNVSQAVGAPPPAGSSDSALTFASSTAPDGASTSASNKVKGRRGGPPGVRFAN